MSTKQVPIWELAGFQARQKDAYNTLLFGDTECKYLLYGGAAGGGKSYYMRWMAVALGCYYFSQYGIKGVPIGLFSEDYPTLRDRQIIKIKREFPEWLGTLKETQSSGFVFEAKPEYGGWVIMLRNLDDPSKYSSVEFAAILVEELTKNTRQTFDELRSRMRFPGIPDVKFVAATNPGGVGHGWVKRLWVKPDINNPDVEAEKFFFVPALYTDNRFIDQNYELQLEAISDPQKRSALKEGNWDIFSGQMFEEYREQRLIDGVKVDWHVTSHIDFDMKDAHKIISFDWGYNAPGAAHWTAIAPENQWGITRLYTYREIHQSGKTPRVWADQIAIYLKYDPVDFMVLPHDCFATPHGNQSIADIFKDTFIKAKVKCKIVQADTMARGARLNRVAVIHQFLEEAPDGKPFWQIAPGVMSLRTTLPELVRDPNHPEDVDTRGDDHDYDSVSTGLMTIKNRYNLSSGAIRPPAPNEQTITPWKQEGKFIQTIDFREVLAQNKHNNSPEKRTERIS